jgi:hypothetical protein
MAWCGRRSTSRLAQPRCRFALRSEERGNVDTCSRSKGLRAIDLGAPAGAPLPSREASLKKPDRSIAMSSIGLAAGRSRRSCPNSGLKSSK